MDPLTATSCPCNGSRQGQLALQGRLRAQGCLGVTSSCGEVSLRTRPVCARGLPWACVVAAGACVAAAGADLCSQKAALQLTRSTLCGEPASYAPLLPVLYQKLNLFVARHVWKGRLRCAPKHMHSAVRVCLARAASEANCPSCPGQAAPSPLAVTAVVTTCCLGVDGLC